MKVHRSPRKPQADPQRRRVLDERVAHCLDCGRIWVGDREIGWDECPKCGNELYPVVHNLVVGEELKLGDGYEARVSQDGLLRNVASTFRALIDQTKCDCQAGVRCLHCRATDLLKDFPGPAEGTLEDDWATLRGRKAAPRPPPPPSDDDARRRRLMQDILDLDETADAYRDTEEDDDEAEFRSGNDGVFGDT